MRKFHFFFWLFFTTTIIFAQGSYYDSINPNLPSFVEDLKNRIRSPYSKVSYDQFDETNIANFAAQPNGSGGYFVTCVYSGYQYNYTGTFTWAVMSREHTWAHSWMPTFDSQSGNEYADQYHLFPTNQNSANSVRSNHPLGVVTTIISSFLDAKYGTNISNEFVYEPRDQHKGDAARALLYMALRYDDVNGYDWDFNWLNNVRLPSLSEAPQSVELLLQWAQADPPDAWEITRNNYIQTIQGNRNPFVDHPEYLAYINFYDMSYLQNGGAYAVEPENYVTGFSTGAINAQSISLNWNDAVAGNQAPSGYLLMISDSVLTAPVDGYYYPDDLNISDGSGSINITHPSGENFSFNGLSGNTSYNFQIYSYNNNGGLINYKTDGVVPSVTSSTNFVLLANEPSNQITNFFADDVTSNSITLHWSNSEPGTQPAAGYILIATSDSIIFDPVDGVIYSEDNNLFDGNARITINAGDLNQFTFYPLISSTEYLFKIFPFSGAGDSINYKTDGNVISVNAATLELTFVTELAAGDIVIVGLNTDDPDEFSFVPLVNIAGGVSINFTDNGWQASGSLRATEGTLIWTAPSYGASTGMIININGGVSNLGTVTSGGGSFALSTTGDQILAYTGNASSPNFIYAVNDEGNGWQADATSSNTSALPSGLTNGISAVALDELDNLIYNGAVTQDVNQLRLDVSNKTNWIGSDEIRQTMPSGFWQIPVELLGFSASVDGNKVTLSWQTVTELNNSGFDVERLKNDNPGMQQRDWTIVGFIKGKGNSTVLNFYSFDDVVNYGGEFSYRLKQIDYDGSVEYSSIVKVSVTSPDEFTLSQNFPNPFNPSTTIAFSIPVASYVNLKVFDILGREVVTLINGNLDAGKHSVNFDAASAGGLSSGLYLYQLNAGSFSSAKKMNLLK
ncbi:MAG: hypothetical protein AUK34_06455 [Ignavibacteria bacterium CG2_30_36_16]|nr:MAG: hypothetical protein AUK34_06455 [Ignavibacteria bacterium CG2_30_36_16]PJB00818.1 MAG: hypothetical protein CO127_06990 [Ignavibacteria bacterium CG_4_9_14_3_um_filter_36_18]